MKNKKTQSFAAGAAVLTIAAVIVKIIGALYKIPLGNILGEEGMGHFGVAYNIYNMLLTISTAGLPVAMSKMVSEANAAGRPRQIRRIFTVAIITFTVLGVAGTSVMLFLNRKLAEVMKDTLASYSILALAPSVLFVCVMSAYRGYTQGHSNMTPSAISQVIEAVCKLVLGMACCWYLMKQGFGYEYGAAGAIMGVTVGTILGAVYLFSHVRRAGYADTSLVLDEPEPDGYGTILRRLIGIGIPITIGSSVLSIISLIDTNLVLRRLQSAAGFTEKAAVELYGGYFNTQTLFNLPSSFITPMTISVIPSVTLMLVEGRREDCARLTRSALLVTTMFAMPAGIGLSVLSQPILHLLYPGKPNLVTIGAPLLAILGIASIFVCIVLLTNALLQAYGKLYVPIVTMVIGGIIKIAVNWFLVGTPSINITGAPIGTLCCYGVIALLNYIALAKYAPGRISIAKTFVKPLIASVIMGAACYGVYTLALKAVNSSRISVLIAIIAGVAVYLVAVIALRVVTKEDLAVIPKGEKIAKLLHIR